MTGQIAVTATDDLYCPRLQRLLGYWQAHRHGDALPGRDDIDPLEMAWILGDLSLVEVHRGAGGLRYRFRLIGSRVAAGLAPISARSEEHTSELQSLMRK